MGLNVETAIQEAIVKALGGPDEIGDLGEWLEICESTLELIPAGTWIEFKIIDHPMSTEWTGQIAKVNGEIRAFLDPHEDF